MANIGDFSKVNVPVQQNADNSGTLKPMPPGAVALQDFLASHNVIPAVPTEPEKQKSTPEPTPIVPPAPVQVTEAMFDAALEQAEKSPEATYEDRLKKFDLTKEQAAEIVDTLLVKGTYEKSYPLTSKVSATFRTRKVEDNDRLFLSLEKERPEYSISISNHVTKGNLIASLASVGKTKFTPDEAGRNAAGAYIQRLPAHVFVLLSSKLAQFDQMITTVLDAGAIENF